MSDFWDDAANSEVPEPPKPSYEGLPDGVTVLCRTTTSEDKETVRPIVKPIEGKNGTFYRFKAPVIIIGGDNKVESKFVGRYLFLDLTVEKPTKAQLEKAIVTSTAGGFESTTNRLKGQLGSLEKFPVSPELYNFILDTLAPEGTSTATRWAEAVSILKAKAKELKYTPEAFEMNTQLLYATTFKEVLLSQSYIVIGKTYTPKQREGSTYVPQQTLGSIGSNGDEQRKKRKVRLMEVITNDDVPF